MESALHASKVYFMHLIQVRCDKRRGKTKAKDNPKDYELRAWKDKEEEIYMHIKVLCKYRLPKISNTALEDHLMYLTDLG